MTNTDFDELEAKMLAWVRKHVHPHYGPASQITSETNLIGDSVLDSLSFLNLLFFVEEQTGYSFNIEEISQDVVPLVVGLCQHLKQHLANTP